MAYDVNELQKRINAIFQEDPTAPTAGGDTWNLYLAYLNMAQQEWQEAYPWTTLYKEVNTMTSQSTGNATLSLPSDFRKVDGFLKISDGGTGSYKQVDPDKRDQMTPADKYYYILGYPGSYNMVINPGTHGSGSSIFYSYWSVAQSLASGADVSVCPDPAFLVQRTLGYLWEARDDARFPGAKAEAEKLLTRMLEYEQNKGVSFDNTIRTVEQNRYGHRIGRD